MTRTVRSESVSALIVQTGREMDQLKADKASLLAALEGLIAYTGGWDAPADHPCGIARDTIAKVKACAS